ncbi:InsA [Aeromonas salmonicida subsp. salmonicida A449]|uniref:InsA n=1 Tax=Aeromonas salmonicida (strain A449) TaxID=382245 RepID=A4SHH1_AERS4|nr:InsA [Aeromonas salmonicida subsp. salmonicida A449]GAJ50775.1 putative transposase [Aeromonas salmonicida subsp. masoucida NBRC 13784]
MMGAFETQLFMAFITVHCLRCHYLHGKTPAGHIHYRCPACSHVFQLTYTYEAREPSVKEKIVEMAFNGSSIRDAARVLNIGINTVLRTLKTHPKASDNRKSCAGRCHAYLRTR